MAQGVEADLCRRIGIRDEMGHGLDERHAQVLPPRAGSQKISSWRAYVPSDVCILREFHAIAFPRRGGLRQGVSA